MNDWLPAYQGAAESPNLDLPIDRLVLCKPCGAPISLHRYAGRWIILRVAQSLSPGTLLPPHVNGLDAVPLNVIDGPVSASDGDVAAAIVFDTSHSIRARFPSLGWPSTFVLDPHGNLVAVLSDQARDTFLADLVRSERSHQSSGTLDRTDIHS